MKLTRGRHRDEASAHTDLSMGNEASEPEISAAPVVVLAAVNLLPATYERRAAVRRAQFFAVFAVLIGAIIVAISWGVSHQRLSGAQATLDSATSEHSRLQAQAVQYAEVPRMFATVATAKQQLELAMGNEVRWSFFLNDLALTMPSGVSLDTLQVTSAAPGASAVSAPPGAASASASTGSTGAGVPGIGTMTVSARALSYNTVAKWLDALAKLPTLTDPYVDTMTAGTEAGTPVVTYSSTASITPDALSRRYQAGSPDSLGSGSATLTSQASEEVGP